METKKIIGMILQIPLYLLVLGSFAASIYAAIYKISGVTWTTPIILAVIIVAFIIGMFLRKNEKKEKQYENRSYQENTPRIPRMETNTQQY